MLMVELAAVYLNDISGFNDNLYTHAFIMLDEGHGLLEPYP